MSEINRKFPATTPALKTRRTSRTVVEHAVEASADDALRGAPEPATTTAPPAAQAIVRELLTKKEVCERLMVSARHLDKMLYSREFPAPTRLGKRDVWSSLPVQHWLDRKFARQEAWRIS